MRKGSKALYKHTGHPELEFKDFYIFEDSWIVECPFIVDLTTNERIKVLDYKVFKKYEWIGDPMKGGVHSDVKRTAIKLEKDIDLNSLFTHNAHYYIEESGPFPDLDYFTESVKEKIGEYPITYNGNLVTVCSEFGTIMMNANVFHDKMREAAVKLGYIEKEDNNGI